MSRFQPFRAVCLTCLCLFLTLCLSACKEQSSKAQENFGKVEFRMTEAQVTELLGAPTECTTSAGTKVCKWKHSTGHLQVSFQNGVVVQKGGISSK